MNSITSAPKFVCSIKISRLNDKVFVCAPLSYNTPHNRRLRAVVAIPMINSECARKLCSRARLSLVSARCFRYIYARAFTVPRAALLRRTVRTSHLKLRGKGRIGSSQRTTSRKIVGRGAENLRDGPDARLNSPSYTPRAQVSSSNLGGPRAAAAALLSPSFSH